VLERHTIAIISPTPVRSMNHLTAARDRAETLCT
jgi:hypothetical protein